MSVSKWSPALRWIAAVASVTLVTTGFSAMFVSPATASVKAVTARHAVAADAVSPDPQDEMASLAAARSSGKRVEVVSERSARSTIWANPDGTLTNVMTADPIRVRQANGSWAAVDQSLTAVKGRLAPAVSATPVTFSADGSGALASLDTGGKTTLGMGFGSAIGTPTVTGSVASYPVTGDASQSVQVGVRSGGFSERVLLAKAPVVAPVFSFPLTLNGLSASLVNGALNLSAQDGTLVARSAQLSMWDSSTDKAGDRANQVPVDAKLLAGSGGSTTLVLSPSMAWLSDPGTVYPVTVDPDVSGIGVLSDTYIDSGDPDANFWGDYRVRVGSPDGTSRFRGIVLFTHTDDFAGKYITAASLSMYQYYGGSCTPATTNVNRTSIRYFNDDATWNNRTGPDVWAQEPQWQTSETSQHTNSGGGCPPAWVNYDVTKMMNGWASGSIADSDFYMTAANETSVADEKRFCSGNPDSSTPCTTSSLEPALSLSYLPSLGVQSWYSTTKHPLNDRSTLLVNNDDGNAVIQAQDVNLNGIGENLSIDRFYNSEATGTTSLGTGGWSLSVGPDVYLEAGASNYRYAYHAPGGTRFGDFVRMSSNTGDSDYKKFYTMTRAGLDADLVDNGDTTFTMTFHGSQTKYVFKKVDTSSNNLYLYQVKDRSGNTITYNYVTNTHQLSSITDTENRTVSLTYTGGYITKITSTVKAANGTTDVTRTWQYGYTGGQLTSYTDPNSKVVNYTYTSGAITKIEDPTNQSGARPTVVLGYYSGNAVQNVTYSRSAGNVGFGFQYGTGSTPACTSTPDRWTKVTDTTTGDAAVNKGPTYCITDRHDASATIHVVDAAGHDKATSYTADNQADTDTAASDSGVTDGATVYTYATDVTDQLSKLTEPKDASGDTAGITSFDYANTTAAGGKWLPTSQLDQSTGNCTGFGYDSKGRTTDAYTGFSAGSATDPSTCTGTSGAKHFHKSYNDSTGTVSFSYDGNGAAFDHSSPTALDSKQTDYTYWASGDTGFVAGTANQLKTIAKPGGSCDPSVRTLCTSYTYDGAGRVATVTDGRGKVTTYLYDALDRVTQVTLNGVTTCTSGDISAGNCVQYTYDAEGNLTSRVEKAGTTSFTYDRMNRQLSQAMPGSTTVSWTRDGAANLLTYQQNIGGTIDNVTYGYDTANRLNAVTDSTGSFAVSSDPDGRPSQITYPTSTGVTATYTYQHSGKPNVFTYKKAGSDLTKSVYSYKNGTSETDQLRTETVTGSITALNSNFTYSYTTADQLMSAANAGGSTFSYLYDAGGNVTKASKSGTSTSTFFGYDRAGELCWSGTGTSTPSGQLATTCAATPSGYTARTSDKAGNNLGTTAAPNAYNGNSQATTNSGATQSFLDLGNNLRTGSGTTTFTNGPLGVSARNTSSGLTFTTRTPDGTILDEHGGGGTRYVLADYQGSVSAIVNSAGTVYGSYLYDPYGKTTVNAEGGSGSADFNPWRYTGAYYNADGAGTYKLGARYYDAQGHFTQPDSLQGTIQNPKTLNSYEYANGDPINNTDPAGYSSLCKQALVEAGALALISGGLWVGSAVATGTIFGSPAGAVLGLGAAVTALGAGIFALQAALVC